MRALRIAVALVTVAVFIACAAAPEDPGPGHARDAVPEADSVRHDLSAALRDIPPVRSPSTSHPALRVPRPAFAVDSPALENLSFAPVLAIPATTRSFDGVGQGFSGPAGTFAITSAPPDTIGDVGPNHYVQVVNTSFAIFNKAGTAVLGPLATNTLFSGFGGACQADNDGDGAVLYDPIADRWVLAQFAVTTGGTTGPFFLCVAVSQTADPTGAWYRYAFPFVNFPDYPKLGVWPDAYYASVAQFNGAGTAFLGPRVCAFDRARMLQGLSATQQCFDGPTTLGILLPADIDGPAVPPVGSAEPVLGLGSATNTLAYYKFHVDWTTPANSTFAGPTAIGVNAFSDACPTGTCIPQTGTAVKLDSLGDRMMHRLAYRNFGDHESLVATHSITAGSATGPRWYELRLDASHNASIFQQGTYAPDTKFRWLGSIALDHMGNAGLGFNVSSTAINPQIHYTGRLVGDAAGTMPQGEGILIDGSGSQTMGLTRWGDYAAMSVDPTDDCTFWFTSEYLAANGSFNWHTRIGSFKFPGCANYSDFALTPSPASIAGGQGTANATTTISSASIASTGTVAQPITMSISGAPAGVTAAFVPAAATVGSNFVATFTIGAAVTAGTYPITVTGTGAPHTHTASISLRVDASPVANGDSFVVVQNGSLTVAAPGVLTNDTDAESEPLTAVLASGPIHGALTLNANGSFLYVPMAGYSGSDSFTYRANDGFGNSNVATVAIRVDAPPVANADSGAVAQNGSLTVAAPGVLANDTDADADPLKAFIASAAANGTVTLNTNGGYTYTPSAGFFGDDSFTYTANDGLASSAAATVSIHVNAPPVANADAYSIAQSGVLTVAAPGVGANDSDPNGDALTFAVSTGVTQGSLTLNANGSFTYTPTPGYFGGDSFTYTANDGTLTATATVTLTVLRKPNAANDSAIAIENTTLSVPAPGVLSNDSDPASLPLTAVLASAPLHGALTLSTSGAWTYTPMTGYLGADSFTYQASNGAQSSDPATVSLFVDARPVAANDSFTVRQDGVLNVAAPGVLGNDSDADADPITATLVTGPSNGVLSLLADGSFQYTPTPGYSGADSFLYAANDGYANSTPATVGILVDATPVAVNDAYSVLEDASLSVAAPGVLANDSDAEASALSASVVSMPAHGVLALSADGSFTYTPVALYSGPDAFTYRASDALASSVATVALTVVHVNHAPVAAADAYVTEIDTALHVSRARGLLANDTDVDVDALTVAIDSQPANGSLAITTDGSFVYVPQDDVRGDDSFTYRVSDGVAMSASTQVSIHIGGVDRGPATPAPVSPAFGDVLKSASQQFVWLASAGDGDVSDPITYRLRVLQGTEVVSDTTTSALTLELAGAIALPAGHYAWQIEAVESHGAVSGPTIPIDFDVGGGHHGCSCSTVPASASPGTGALALLAGLALLVRRRP